MKKLIITLAAVLSLTAASPGNTQDDTDSAWQAKFLTNGFSNCSLWNVNDSSWKQGYLYGFGNGFSAGSLMAGYLANSNSAFANSTKAFNMEIPSKLQYGEIEARIDYACSQPANAQKPLTAVIAKIAADVNEP